MHWSMYIIRDNLRKVLASYIFQNFLYFMEQNNITLVLLDIKAKWSKNQKNIIA